MKVAPVTTEKPNIQIELTHEEARMLNTIMVGVEWDKANRIHRFAEDLSDCLVDFDAEVLDNVTFSFSNNEYLEVNGVED